MLNPYIKKYAEFNPKKNRIELYTRAYKQMSYEELTKLDFVRKASNGNGPLNVGVWPALNQIEQAFCLNRSKYRHVGVEKGKILLIGIKQNVLRKHHLTAEHKEEFFKKWVFENAIKFAKETCISLVRCLKHWRDAVQEYDQFNGSSGVCTECGGELFVPMLNWYAPCTQCKPKGINPDSKLSYQEVTHLKTRFQ